MRVAFTGTRHGMNAAQVQQLRYVLALFCHADRHVGRTPEFHYGTHETAVLLADVQAASLAKDAGYTLVPHHARPGEELARDRQEADDCDVMVAAPKSDKEQLRSGTWATVRYARARLKPVVMLSRGDSGRLPLRRASGAYRS
jgi:hypothetical protein